MKFWVGWNEMWIPCITIAIWCCCNPFSQWQRSFQWSLCSHWQKYFRKHHIAVIIQHPGACLCERISTTCIFSCSVKKLYKMLIYFCDSKINSFYWFHIFGIVSAISKMSVPILEFCHVDLPLCSHLERNTNHCPQCPPDVLYRLGESYPQILKWWSVAVHMDSHFSLMPRDTATPSRSVSNGRLLYVDSLCRTSCQNPISRFKLSETGLIPGLRPANERRRYKVTPSLIGWAET